MSSKPDVVTFTVSRKTLSQFIRLSEKCADRMHALLERNSHGMLNAIECAELESLVAIAEFGQIAATALHGLKTRATKSED